MERKSLTRLALAGIMAGSFALTACEKDSTGPKTETKTGITAATTLSAFQAECTKAGGAFAAHGCSGLNDCKGHSYLEGKEVSAHDCKGQSTCAGGSCIES